MKKIKLIQTISITSILLLNTGCFFGFFGDEPKVQTHIKDSKPPEISKSVATSVNTTREPLAMNIAVECTDEIDSPCQKSPIAPAELKTKQLITPTGEEVYKLQSIQGKRITIIEKPTGYLFPEFQNKIVILEMFGKDCSHCIKEMPIMNKLRKRYRNHLEIVALQVEGKMSSMQSNALIRRHRIQYPIISGATATNLQYHVQSTYGWTGILPFIMVIKDGVTEFTYRGEVTYTEINRDIRSLLP